VSITSRDRKILLALVPLALIAAYWFLVLSPKREEATRIQDQLTQAQSERDTAVQKAASLAAAKRSFGTDYATVIYLGKSIPSSVDMPSLLVQLDRAARGTGIKFTSIQAGERQAATPTTGAAPGTAPNGGTGPANSSAPAQSAPGGAAQSAGNAVNESDNSSAAAGASQPAGSSPSGSATTAPTGLDSVPLDFQFDGSFFDLADFFHRMKRFVRVANSQIVVRGRLMTVNSFSFDSKDQFPQLSATVHATVYLAPKAEAAGAGSTPSGTGTAPAPAGSGNQTADSGSSSPTPAASVSTR
jgi:Tfp pilus assembly protein PilO